MPDWLYLLDYTSNLELCWSTLKAYQLFALIQQRPRLFQAFGFRIDADQRFCAGKADEQPGLIAEEEAKTFGGIYFGHLRAGYGAWGTGA